MSRYLFTVTGVRSKVTRPLEHPTPIPQKSHAFTLVELAVVLGVLALLGLVLLPAMAETADRSRRARCQENLRQIALGVTAYAGNNNGKIFAARSVDTTYVQIAMSLPDMTAASSARLTFETNGLWTCPSRPGLPLTNSATRGSMLGYQYFGGINTWINPAGAFASLSPTNLNTAKPYWALAADAIIKVDGKWGGDGTNPIYSNLPPHTAENSLIPQGGNQAFVDGSVQWIEAEKMYFLSSWSSSARQAYWYQDSKDFPTLLKNVLPLLRFRP